MHRRHDGKKITANARRNFLRSFETLVDPRSELPPEERAVRARAALSGYMRALGERGSPTRSRKNGNGSKDSST